MAIDKKALSEADIRTKYITPAIEQAGWDKMSQMREEYSITAGRIIARGQVCKREKPLKADYVLFYKPNKPIAICGIYYGRAEYRNHEANQIRVP